MVGNIVQGNRLAAAQGRELRFGDDEANPANKVLYSFSAAYTCFLTPLVAFLFEFFHFQILLTFFSA